MKLTKQAMMALSMVALAACAHHKQKEAAAKNEVTGGTVVDETTSGTTAAPATKVEQATAKPVKDAEAAEIVATANTAEIELAKLAQTKTQNPEVKAFADKMVAEHTANKQEGKHVAGSADIKAKSSSTSSQLKRDAKSDMDQLRGKRGAEFDKAYISTQVNMHQQLLSDLNDRLIPGAENMQFRSYLEETRDHVQAHLDKAEALQASLK